MDHQAFFKNDKAAFLQEWCSARQGVDPEPCPYIVFDHFDVHMRVPPVAKVADRMTGLFRSKGLQWSSDSIYSRSMVP
jgi:hypothetical protein